MIKGNFQSIQPFFVLKTSDYKKQMYKSRGISHFYSFTVTEKGNMLIVPDGCVDIWFLYRNGKMEAFVTGTYVESGEIPLEVGSEIFGVRFMPGYRPFGLSCGMRDLVGATFPLYVVMDSESMITKLRVQTDFYQRIMYFIEEYVKLEKYQKRSYGKTEIAIKIRDMACNSDGKIRVAEMADISGYSVRYINRVFMEEMGISPKTFCNIIRFQRTLEFLNYGKADKMTDAAVDLGYYDQSQFIREFKSYCGITPKKYLELIEREKYMERIKLFSFDL